MKIIAAIEAPAVIVRILTHLVLPARAMQSRCVEFSPLGSMQSPKNHASGELAPNTARLTACRAGDIVADSQKKRLNFLFAAGKADTWTKYREPFFLIDELQLTDLFKKAGLKK